MGRKLRLIRAPRLNFRPKQEMSRKRIRTAPWVYAVLAFFAAFCTLGIAFMSAAERGWEFLGAVVFLVLCLIALLVAVFTKIENNDQFVTIVSNLTKVEIPKTSIEKVTWEKGVGSFLKLVNGAFVKLPATGRNEQGVANSVRSWLSLP
jgi:hypothetical protein